MRAGDRSLRLLVEKWLAPTAATPLRVTRCTWTHASLTRGVRVETIRNSAPVTLLFFRHDDGTWCVFPPSAGRLTMHADGRAS